LKGYLDATSGILGGGHGPLAPSLNPPLDRNSFPHAKFTGTRADEFPPTGWSINGLPAIAIASLGRIADC